MATATASLTIDQFVALSEAEPALEFDGGVVTQKVSAKGQHSALQVELTERINLSARPNEVTRAFTERRATFGGASRVPDIAVYRWTRIPREVNGRIANDFRDPPDIAIEIASPEQGTNALVRRCLWYTDHGVHVALLVVPSDESVLAFRSVGGVQVYRESDRIDLAEVLPDFDLSVDQLFSSLR